MRFYHGLSLSLTCCLIAVSSAFKMAALAVMNLLSLFTPEPFRWQMPNPKSIFETRRLGLA